MLTTVLSHLLAVYVMVAAPWLGRHLFQRVKERIQAGVPNAKLRLYRELVLEQILSTIAVLALLRRIPPSRLGLTAPYSWAQTIAILLLIVAALVWSSLRLRPAATRIRKQLKSSVGFLIPDTPRERPWFGAVSLGAGISEELAFRGFLLYYFAVYLPQLNSLEKAVIAAAFFGLAHLYQGWKGVAGTGVLGLILVGLYLFTGSLLLPMAVHAAIDLRGLLIFPPIEPQAMPVEATA